jgi:regulation of enolase protein 1 (concanavalin A-like superfamily)
MYLFLKNQIVNINGHSNNVSNVLADVYGESSITNYTGIPDQYFIKSARSQRFIEIQKHSNGKTWYVK